MSVEWENCRDIGDQQELEPPPDVPPNEVRDKKTAPQTENKTSKVADKD